MVLQKPKCKYRSEGKSTEASAQRPLETRNEFQKGGGGCNPTTQRRPNPTSQASVGSALNDARGITRSSNLLFNKARYISSSAFRPIQREFPSGGTDIDLGFHPVTNTGKLWYGNSQGLETLKNAWEDWLVPSSHMNIKEPKQIPDWASW